jgi:alkylation response protein AidB-like acyl-CoA dehydrogenase
MIADVEAIEDGLDRALTSVLSLPLLLDHAARDQQLGSTEEGVLRKVGWFAVALEEADGGIGLDAGGLISVGAAAGRRLVPIPLREEAVAVIPLLALLARRGDAQAAAWLTGALEGQVRGGTALAAEERAGGDDGAAPRGSRARSAMPAWLAPNASLLAMVAGNRAAIEAIPSTSLSIDALAALEPGQGFSEISFANKAANLRWVDGPDVSLMLRRRLAFLVGEAFGCAEQCLERTVDHARNREQFGRPLATFQAVAHQLADMTMQVETLRSALSRLDESWREEDTETAEKVLMSLGWAAPNFARSVCETAIQLHGGTGFTWEYGLHLHYRRALQLEAAFGGVRGSAAAVAAHYIATGRRRVDGR